MPTNVYNTSGQTTWTVPAGVYLLDEIFCIGRGGSGGPGNIGNSRHGGGGGGSSRRLSIAVTPGDLVTIRVAAVSGGGDGYTGTSVLINSIERVFAANGSNASFLVENCLGGQAASGVGTEVYSGGNGGGRTSFYGGGGGSSGGRFASGANGHGLGVAGIAPSGGGNGGAGGLDGGRGATGFAPGGGGGGAGNLSNIAGQGATGLIEITYRVGESGFFSVSGLSTANMISAALKESSFASAGTATVSNPGNVNRQSAFASVGLATVSNPGAHKFASAFSSVGIATAEMEGSSLFRSSFNAAGTSTAIMVGAGNNASSFSSISSSSANMVGASTAESSFNAAGTSLVVMFSPSIVSSSFSAAGTSTANMISPNVTVTTLIDGSGGAGLATVIDYSLCDFAQVILSAGVGTYSIEHVNLIPGKWITVTLVNQGASGSLIWNNGDAPVDWSPALAPDFPANGETLDLEFFVRRDRSVIRGRRAFA